MGHHKPVPGGWVGDVEGSVAVQHLDEEGGLHRAVGGEAGAQRVDDRRGTITEVSVGRGRRQGRQGLAGPAQEGEGKGVGERGRGPTQ